MNPLVSLRGRIFIATATLTLLSIGAAIYLVSVRVTAELEASLRREIVTTAALVEQFRTSRTQTFTTLARLIADTPKLKAAVDTNDPPTVQNAANDYQGQLASSLLLVTNARGDVLATIGASGADAGAVARQPAIAEALAGGEGLSLLHRPDGILHMVTVPILLGVTEPQVLGTLSVGFLLDDEFASQLKAVTGSDLAFAMDGQVVSSSLGETDRARLSALLGAAQASDVQLSTGEYVTLALSLGAGPEASGPARPFALVLRSRTDETRFLGQIHTELAVTALGAVLLATVLSLAVARTITRPLKAITDVMRDVAATGDLTRKIVLRTDRRWGDEEARLLASTFNGLTDSVARAQREIAQRERLSSLGRLSTVVAHEVRNPLMIIKAALHALRRPDLSAGELREVAADIDGEVARLNRLVNDVLDYARPLHFDRTLVDLNAVCRDSASAAQATPGAPISLRLAPDAGTLLTDGERLRLALVNLLVNARHAVEGRAPADVVLATRRASDDVVIEVSDTGAGIAAQDLARVFEPFFTTRRGGTGLGLPITRNIVEGLGGTIGVSSEVDRGTTIRIVLPLAGSGSSTVHSGSETRRT